MRVRPFLIALLALFLAACSPEKALVNLLAKNTPAKLLQQAKADLSRLETAGELKLPPPVQQIGYHRNMVVGQPATMRIVFESAADTNGKRLLAILDYTESDSHYLFQRLRIEERETSALEIPNLRISQGSAAGWIIVILGTVALLISMIAGVLAARTKGLKRKWLWVTGCLFSLGSFSTGWMSGQVSVRPVSVQLFGFGAFAPLGAIEWVFSFGIPVIALLFLWQLRKGKLSISSQATEVTE